MDDWRQQLQAWATPLERMVVLAIGNETHADDGVARLVIDRIGSAQRLNPVWAATAPESAFPAVRSLRPSHVLVVDAVDFQARPGEIGFFSLEQADDFPSTHSTPPSLWALYLSDVGCKWAVLGIKPRSMEFCGDMSDEVKRGAAQVALVLQALDRRI